MRKSKQHLKLKPMKTAEVRGNKIREAREEAGLSLNGLAQLIGADPSTISRWETSRDFPKFRRLMHALVKLGIDPIDFFDLSAE